MRENENIKLANLIHYRTKMHELGRLDLSQITQELCDQVESEYHQACLDYLEINDKEPLSPFADYIIEWCEEKRVNSPTLFKRVNAISVWLINVDYWQTCYYNFPYRYQYDLGNSHDQLFWDFLRDLKIGPNPEQPLWKRSIRELNQAIKSSQLYDAMYLKNPRSEYRYSAALEWCRDHFGWLLNMREMSFEHKKPWLKQIEEAGKDGR